MNVIQFRNLGQRPSFRFGNATPPAQNQPTPEQIQAWKDKVMNSPIIDPYIKSTLSIYENPFPIPMLARSDSPSSSDQMRQQEEALKAAGLINHTRIGSILALQAPTLESLAKLTEIPFIISTEASR